MKKKAITKKINIPNLSFVVDLIAITVLLSISFSFNCSESIRELIKEAHDAHFNADSLITLLPVIITVVSISLSMSKEKLYGVTYKEFNSMRGKFYYGFLHMVITCCVLFLLLGIFNLAGLDTFAVALDFVSLLYCLYFSIQEIPVLMRSEWLIKLVLRKQYSKLKATDDLNSQANTAAFGRMLTNIIFNRGIITAFNVLLSKRKKNESTAKNVLAFLLEKQNDYLFRLKDESEVLLLERCTSFEDIDFTEIINRGYLNVKESLAGIQLENRENVCFGGEYLYLFTRSIFALHYICEKLHLENNEINGLNHMILIQCSSIGKNRNKIPLENIFSVGMLATTISKGETWFIRSLRDSDGGYSLLFNTDWDSIGVFATMMMSCVLTHNLVDHKSIKDFFAEDDHGLNAEGMNWARRFAFYVEHISCKEWVGVLKQLITMYDSIPGPFFYFGEQNSHWGFSTSDNFNRTDVLNDWIEVLLLYVNYEIDLNQLTSALQSLPPKWKKELVSVLNERWLDNGNLKNNLELKFLNSLSLPHIDIRLGFYCKEIVSCFEEWRNDYQKNKILDDIGKENPDFKKELKTIEEHFANTFQSFQTLDKNILVGEEDAFYFPFTCDCIGFQKLMDAYLDTISRQIAIRAQKEILKKATVITLGDNSAEEKVHNLLNEEKPQYRSQSFFGIYDFDEELVKQINDINIAKSDEIPSSCLFNKKGIKINGAYLPQHTILRYCTDDEVEQLIDRDYQTLNNGLYRYQAYSADISPSIYVTRKELHDILKKRTILVRIVLKEKILVNPNECWILKSDYSK